MPNLKKIDQPEGHVKEWIHFLGFRGFSEEEFLIKRTLFNIAFNELHSNWFIKKIKRKKKSIISTALRENPANLLSGFVSLFKERK